MKIDFNQPICNPYGASLNMTVDGASTEEPFLLGHVAVNALTAPVQGDKRDAMQKVACWKLSQRLFTIDGSEYNFQVVDLASTEIALLIDLIEKVYPSPAVYAQAREMLEHPERVEPAPLVVSESKPQKEG